MLRGYPHREPGDVNIVGKPDLTQYVHVLTKRLMKHNLAAYVGTVLAVSLGSFPALADPTGDLASRKSEWSQIQRRMEEVTSKISSYLDRSKRLREMDKTELDGLITQICRQDIAYDDDEADRLAKSITDKIVENVNREYDSLDEEADRVIEEEAEDILNDAKSLRDSTDDLLSSEEVKSETESLPRDERGDRRFHRRRLREVLRGLPHAFEPQRGGAQGVQQPADPRRDGVR